MAQIIKYIVGNPCSGKSTMIRKFRYSFVKNSNTFVYDVDNYNDYSILQTGFRSLTDMHEKACKDGEKVLVSKIQEKFDIIIPCTYRGIKVGMKHFDYFKEQGIEIHIYYIEPNYEEEKERNSLRKYPVPDEIFSKNNDSMEELEDYIHKNSDIVTYSRKLPSNISTQNKFNEEDTIGVFCGSFDPLTCGHLDTIERASRMFDKVIVCIMINNDKKYSFTLEQRLNMLEKCIGDWNDIEIDSWNGLMVDYCSNKGATTIVRGVRNATDFDFEMQINKVNKTLGIHSETIFIPCSPEFEHVSSSVVKELAKYDHSLMSYVPDKIRNDVKKVLSKS